MTGGNGVVNVYFLFSFVKLALTKNPKKRPAAERMLFHPFVLAGDLSIRLSVDLLSKVRNPESMTQCFEEPDEDGIVHNVPRRISSKAPKNKSNVQQQKSGECKKTKRQTKREVGTPVSRWGKKSDVNSNFWELSLFSRFRFPDEIPKPAYEVRQEPQRFNGISQGWNRNNDENPEVRKNGKKERRASGEINVSSFTIRPGRTLRKISPPSLPCP